MLLLGWARPQWKLYRNIFGGVGVVNSFGSQKLNRNQPVLHFVIRRTCKEKISHAIFYAVLVNPLTGTERERRAVATFVQSGRNSLVNELDLNRPQKVA